MMHSRRLSQIMTACQAVLLSHPLAAHDYPITPVPFTDIKLTDTLRTPRQDTNRRVTVAPNFREMDKQGSLDAFLDSGRRRLREISRLHVG